MIGKDNEDNNDNSTGTSTKDDVSSIGSSSDGDKESKEEDKEKVGNRLRELKIKTDDHGDDSDSDLKMLTYRVGLSLRSS